MKINEESIRYFFKKISEDRKADLEFIHMQAISIRANVLIVLELGFFDILNKADKSCFYFIQK